MNFLELISAFSSSIQALTQLADKVVRALPAMNSIMEKLVSTFAYETLSLDYVFDIRDPKGRRAVIKRRQRVRFRIADGGVVRDLVWGEGDPLADYSVQGARCAGIRQEGSRRVVLLALPQRPSRGDKAVVTSSRTARNPIPGPTGYAESSVERPTRQLSLKVLFPRSRPPLAARLISTPSNAPSISVPTRYGSDGRPYLSWRKQKPKNHVTFSLEWAW